MQKVNLNLIPGGVCPVVNVSQYDEGRQFQLAIFQGTASYDLTGKTVTIEVGKTDGNGCAYDATDTVNGVPVVAFTGNLVTITTPVQMTACAGDNKAELKILDSTAEIGTLNFILLCEQSALSPDTPISETEIPAIVDAAEANAERAEAAVEHYPYINTANKNWMVWDVETGAFVDTGVRAEGIDGEGSVQSVNNIAPDVSGNVSLPLATGFSDILPTTNGGTGNADGYIRTGQASGSTAGTKATIEGNDNIASGANGIICGDNNTAWSYNNCLVAGEHNKASADNQIVGGKYNASGSNYLLILGNGTDANNTSNALSVNNKGEMLIGRAEDAYAPASDFASFESHMTASAANPHNASHAPGTYLYVPHKFYRVISQTTISQTESFVVGTNVEEVRLADVLSSISSDLSNKEITVTKNTSVVSSNSAVRCFRCANIVFVAFDINVLSGAAVDSVIATDLPTAINPGAVGRTTKGFDVFVTTDGKLQIQSTPSTGWAKGSVTYMT